MRMTTKEIADLLNFETSTLRTWLGSYRFTKYSVPCTYPLEYYITQGFVNELKNYLSYKKSISAMKLSDNLFKLAENV